jgi:SagB-type dehydrogenase family enzyme
LFRYEHANHALTNLSPTDIRTKIADTTLGQKFVAEAGLVVILTTQQDQSVQIHGDKVMRYIYLEAGHIAQNIHLEAASLGLGSSPVAAFHELSLKSALDFPDDLIPIYIIPVGHPKQPLSKALLPQRPGLRYESRP